uniref:Uncharacterized protein n=1 Tax=Anguilla anguilla TaxID=7936 RepID=A0A0E9RQ59_ANGAN
MSIFNGQRCILIVIILIESDGQRGRNRNMTREKASVKYVHLIADIIVTVDLHHLHLSAKQYLCMTVPIKQI